MSILVFNVSVFILKIKSISLQFFIRFWSVNVNVILLTFQTVYLVHDERPYRSPFLDIPERPTFHDRSWAFLVIKRPQTVENAHGTLCKRSRTVNGCNTERLGTFETGRSNALVRIVENVHVHASKTKEHWKNNILSCFCYF